MPLLVLNNISRRYDSTPAVKDISFEINRGEFFGLLGPSGCGKTTTLRMIAGLEKPDGGTISFDGRDITSLAPEARGFGMVFQNYALFPHLSVFDNIAFGLRARRQAKPEIAERVALAGWCNCRVTRCRTVRRTTATRGYRAAIAIEPALLV